MPILDAKSLFKSFGARTLLDDVSVTIRTGERVGLLGRNGSGKSTLARILAGLEPADRGVVMRRRDTVVEYLPQVPAFSGNPTAFEAAATALRSWQQAVERHARASEALGSGANVHVAATKLQQAADEVELLGGWDFEHHVRAMLQQLGILAPEQRVDTLSGGELRRIALARLLLTRPDLAVLDEPTNHLDAETVEWLEEYLIEQHVGGILLITHDRYLLDRVSTRTLELSRGKIYSYEGGYERYLEQKAEREVLQQRTEQNRRNFLRTELEWLRRQPKARTTKQKARIDRAEHAQARRPPETTRSASFHVELTRSGKTILDLRDLVGGVGGQRLFGPLDVSLRSGARIGVLGPNGSGKTTLLRTLLGELAPLGGSVTWGQNTRVAYFDQGRSGLDAEKSVIEGVLGDQAKVDLGGETVEPRSYLLRFGFDVDQQRQPISSLSGGEHARAALAKVLKEPMNLILLDEPTNDLDVETLGALESLLLDRNVTAVVVTHDRWFLDRVATAILAFDRDNSVTLHEGNYTTYKRLRAEKQARFAPGTASAAPPAPQGARQVRAAKPRRLSQKDSRELSELPERIEAMEQLVTDLTTRMGDPSLYAEGGHRAAALNAELEQARARLQTAYTRWEELESLRESLLGLDSEPK